MPTSLSVDILRRLGEKMQATARKYAPSVSLPSNAPVCTLSPSDLVLPTPQSPTPQLLALGIDEKNAHLISLALLRTADLLKGRCEAAFRQRCEWLRTQPHLYLAQDPKFTALVSAFTLIYSKTIRDWTTYLFDNVAPRIKSLVSHGDTPHLNRKRSFNHTAIPILEHFFDHNAFPTRLEKYELASRCDMEYRQIHVWFQNRRARYRKDGRDLKQRDASGSFMEELENSVVTSVFPVEQEVDDDDDDVQCPVKTQVSRSFNFPDPPAHAFPSPYPPVCSGDPFPDTPSRRALDIPWPRTVQPSSRPKDDSVGVEQLVADLARLNISDESPAIHASLSSMASSGNRHCWLPIGFTTPCVRAPHPAFLCKPQRRSRPSYPMARKASHAAHPTKPIQPNCTIPRANYKSSRWMALTPPEGETPSLPSPPSKRTLPRRVPRHPPSHCNSFGASVPYRSRCSSTSSELSSCGSTLKVTSGTGSDCDSPLSSPVSVALVLANKPTEFPDNFSFGVIESPFFDPLSWSISIQPSEVDELRFGFTESSLSFPPTCDHL